jgi:hypothetical protein
MSLIPKSALEIVTVPDIVDNMSKSAIDYIETISHPILFDEMLRDEEKRHEKAKCSEIFGFTIRVLTPGECTTFNLDSSKDYYIITSIENGSVASIVGLKVGDVLIGVYNTNGRIRQIFDFVNEDALYNINGNRLFNDRTILYLCFRVLRYVYKNLLSFELEYLDVLSLYFKILNHTARFALPYTNNDVNDTIIDFGSVYFEKYIDGLTDYGQQQVGGVKGAATAATATAARAATATAATASPQGPGRRPQASQASASRNVMDEIKRLIEAERTLPPGPQKTAMQNEIQKIQDIQQKFIKENQERALAFKAKKKTVTPQVKSPKEEERFMFSQPLFQAPDITEEELESEIARAEEEIKQEEEARPFSRLSSQSFRTADESQPSSRSSSPLSFMTAADSQRPSRSSSRSSFMTAASLPSSRSSSRSSFMTADSQPSSRSSSRSSFMTADSQPSSGSSSSVRQQGQPPIFGSQGMGQSLGAVTGQGMGQAASNVAAQGMGQSLRAVGAQGMGQSLGAVGTQGMGQSLGAVGTQGMGQSLGAVGAQGMGQSLGAVGTQGMGQSLGAVGAQGMGQSLGAVGAQGMGQATSGVGAQGMGQATSAVGAQGMGQATSAVGAQGMGQATSAVGAQGMGQAMSGVGTQGMGQATSAVGAQGMGQATSAVGAQGMGQATSGVGAQGMGQATSGVGTQGMGQAASNIGSQGVRQAISGVAAQGVGQAASNIGAQGVGQSASAVRVQDLITRGLSRGELPTGTLIQGNIDISNQRFLLMNLYLNVIFKTLLSNNALKQKYDKSKIQNKPLFVPLVIQEKYMISPPQFYQLEAFPKIKFNDLDVIRKLNDVNLETKINENVFMGGDDGTRVTKMKLKENTRIKNKKNKFLIKLKNIKPKKHKTIKKKIRNIKQHKNELKHEINTKIKKYIKKYLQKKEKQLEVLESQITNAINANTNTNRINKYNFSFNKQENKIKIKKILNSNINNKINKFNKHKYSNSNNNKKKNTRKNYN